MISHRTQGSILLMGTMLGVVIIAAISACDTAHSLPAAPAAQVQEPTGVPTQPQATGVSTETPNPTTVFEATRSAYATTFPATRAAYDTRTAQLYSDVRTKYALDTPVPIPTLGPPLPTPTWEMGMQSCVNLPPSYYPQQYGCWRGYINGQLISVSGGREGRGEGDWDQGILMVFDGPLFDPTAPTTEVYTTPVKIGAVQLLSVNGTLATLVPVDFPRNPNTPTPPISPTPYVVFVFDLSTRQWVGTPGPSPSASVSPLPSVSPMPTLTALP